jgi:hypothetical protein
MRNIAQLLQSLDQAHTPKELDKAVDSLLAKMVVSADDDGDSDVEIPDDVSTGTMSNRANGKQSNMVPEAHVRNLLVEIILMHREMNKLESDLEALHTYVDRNKDDVIATAISWIISQSDALRALTVYDSAWFSRLPYSINLKIDIAQALIDACKTYGITNDFWQNLTEYNPAAIDFAAYSLKS